MPENDIGATVKKLYTMPDNKGIINNRKMEYAKRSAGSAPFGRVMSSAEH